MLEHVDRTCRRGLPRSQAALGALLPPRICLYSSRMLRRPGRPCWVCPLSALLLLLLLLLLLFSSGCTPSLSSEALPFPSVCLLADSEDPRADSSPVKLAGSECAGAALPEMPSCKRSDCAVAAVSRLSPEAEAVSKAAQRKALLLIGADAAARVLTELAVSPSVCAWRIAALRVASRHSDMRAVDACICFRVKGSSAARTPVQPQLRNY